MFHKEKDREIAIHCTWCLSPGPMRPFLRNFLRLPSFMNGKTTEGGSVKHTWRRGRMFLWLRPCSKQLSFNNRWRCSSDAWSTHKHSSIIIFSRFKEQAMKHNHNTSRYKAFSQAAMLEDKGHCIVQTDLDIQGSHTHHVCTWSSCAWTTNGEVHKDTTTHNDVKRCLHKWIYWFPLL